MNVKEIRRLNLTAIIKNYNNYDEFEEASGASANYANQIVNGTREMGDQYAKRVQEGLGLSDGWLDHLHGEDEAKEAASPKLVSQRKKIQNLKHLTTLFRQMDYWAKARKLGELSPNQRAVLFQRAIDAEVPEESPNYEECFDNVIEMQRYWKTR